jgi:hypothetical protein
MAQQWDQWSCVASDASGFAVFSEDGVAVCDPAQVGEIVDQSLQIGWVRTTGEIKSPIPAVAVERAFSWCKVLDYRFNPIMLFELVVSGDILGAAPMRDVFVRILTTVGAAQVRTSTLAVALDKLLARPEVRIVSSPIASLPDAALDYVLFWDYVDRNALVTWTPEYFEDIKFWQGQSALLNKIKTVGTVMSLLPVIHVCIRLLSTEMLLDETVIPVQRLNLRLRSEKQEVGIGLSAGVLHLKSFCVRARNEIVGAAWKTLVKAKAKEIELVVVNRITQLLVRKLNMDPMVARLGVSGAVAGFVVAREAFNTAGVASTLSRCEAAVKIEECSRQTYAVAARELKKYGRLDPAPQEVVSEAVWLARLAQGGAASFYLGLVEVLGDKGNLLNELNKLSLRDWKLVYDPQFDNSVASLRELGMSAEQSAQGHVPGTLNENVQDPYGAKAFACLMKVARCVPTEPSNTVPTSAGMLDVVLCIDQSGSMMDDIRMVQTMSDKMLEALTGFAKENNISLTVGLVTYTRHDETDWLQATSLTDHVPTIRSAIQAISITDIGLGKGGNEDMYGAMTYAMQEPVNGTSFPMGWRQGAAKILLPIGDEAPDDPDWEGRKLEDVARIAEELDPVHMYPLLTPQQGFFLDPAVRAFNRLASATGGQVVKVESAEKLPEALVETVKLAVRRHRNEVWRKENPPYLLYWTIAAIGGCALIAVGVLLVRSGVGRTSAGRAVDHVSRRRRFRQ